MNQITRSVLCQKYHINPTTAVCVKAMHVLCTHDKPLNPSLFLTPEEIPTLSQQDISQVVLHPVQLGFNPSVAIVGQCTVCNKVYYKE